MDSRKVLSFLNMIRKEVTGHDDEFAELYQRALDENDEIVHLKDMLNAYNYYRSSGNVLFESGKRILDDIYSHIDEALEMIPEVKRIGESIDNEAMICEKLMKSPYPFDEEISMLRKKDTVAYLKAFKLIAGTCVYLLCLYSGASAINGLAWSDLAGIQEMIYSINHNYLPALCEVKADNRWWVIIKRRLGGGTLFGGDGFFLSYMDCSEIRTLFKIFRKEPFGTHAYLNLDAYERGELDVPFCWGRGNIVSSLPNTALSFLQNSVVTRLRSPGVNELKRKMPTPLQCISELSNNESFCISPDELVLAMNRWQMGHEIEMRKDNHKCLFCGANISGKKLVCSVHFTTEL